MCVCVYMSILWDHIPPQATSPMQSLDIRQCDHPNQFEQYALINDDPPAWSQLDVERRRQVAQKLVLAGQQLELSQRKLELQWAKFNSEWEEYYSSKKENGDSSAADGLMILSSSQSDSSMSETQSDPSVSGTERTIGNRVLKYWGTEKRFFAGVIIDMESDNYLVRYDDGDEAWENDVDSPDDAQRCRKCESCWKFVGHRGRCNGQGRSRKRKLCSNSTDV